MSSAARVDDSLADETGLVHGAIVTDHGRCQAPASDEGPGCQSRTCLVVEGGKDSPSAACVAAGAGERNRLGWCAEACEACTSRAAIRSFLVAEDSSQGATNPAQARYP